MFLIRIGKKISNNFDSSIKRNNDDVKIRYNEIWEKQEHVVSKRELFWVIMNRRSMELLLSNMINN